MSHPGRQSPSPSRQSGQQQSDLPGWSGKAEQGNHGTGPIRNPAATSHLMGGAEQKQGQGAQGRQQEQDTGVAGLESNPVHPLEREAEYKAERRPST